MCNAHLVRESTDRTEVDNVAAQLGVEVLLDVGANLGGITTTGDTEVVDAGDLPSNARQKRVS